MPLQAGQTAPDFILYDSEKKQLRLSETRATNVLLLFFPLAFTSTCTKELCSVRDTLAWYNDVQARVIAISVDSHYVLAKYKAEQQLNFTLLSDFNKEASIAYESIYQVFSYSMKGVSKRSAFVIDKTGIIRYAEVLENAGEVPNFNAIQEVLGKLK